MGFELSERLEESGRIQRLFCADNIKMYLYTGPLRENEVEAKVA